jgi:hypothetical protein
MSDPKHQGVWPSLDAFMDDFKRSMRNLSTENAIPSAELLGNGNVKLGETKRDLIASAMNVTLPKRLDYINQPTIDPLSMITPKGKERRIGGSSFRDFRIERVTEITPTTERLKVVQENAYDKLVQRFQPDSFTPETLPNGEAWTNPDGYRILKKTGSKLYRVYDKDGTDIGATSSQDAAIKKAQDSFLKSEKKAEGKISIPVEFVKSNSFKSLEGNFDVYSWKGSMRDGEATVHKSKDGFVIRNVRVPDSAQKQGIGTALYRAINEQSLKMTGKPLRSTQPRTLSDGRKVLEMTDASKNLWKSLVKKGEAVNLPDGTFEFVKKAENVRFQPITPEQDAAYINAVKSGDSETAQKMVDEAAKKAAPSKSVILYRGLEKPLDPNYDPNMRDSPSGYSTWTDNPLLARQYAGKNGNIYAIFVPKSEVKADYINSDGDRSFVYATGKKAGLNNVAGKEFLLYEDHDLFSPSQIKSADPVTYDDAGNVIPLSQRFNPGSNDIRFQPDPSMPSVLNGSNGTRIIKSNSGKFRVYSGTGALLGIRDTQQAAEKLAAKP